jgi:hypothetical protein
VAAECETHRQCEQIDKRRLFLNNWSDYEIHMHETSKKDLQPHRVKYRILKR